MIGEACIAHPPKQAIAIVRQDYYEIAGRDACGAALLNLFEYWANAAIAKDPTAERPWVGGRPIREFEQMLLGIATDKQIRKRLVRLEALGYIQTAAPARRGMAKAYQVCLPEIQQAISALGSDITKIQRSFDRPSAGQTTEASPVKQPEPLRSNDRALKKKTQEFKQEDPKEEGSFSNLNKSAAIENKIGSSRKPVPTEVGTVHYAQSPESIDLAELWETNLSVARSRIRSLAPGHKRPDMVAHGVGHWWLGPNLNDFDDHLIQACRNRKRKFQQADSVGDAKTYINNMLRNGDWGNFALRCEEAEVLRQRTAKPQRARERPTQQGKPLTNRSPFERSDRERQASAIGLARFKVSRGEIERAKAIARQFGLSLSAIGLSRSSTSCVA